MVHSGNFSAELGPTSEGFLDQNIVTVPGQMYTVDFWLAQGLFGGAGPNDFSASFAGVTIVSLTNSGPFPYTHYTMNIMATSTSTDLHFAFFNSPDYWYLDDVCVIPIGGATPTPTATATPTSTCGPAAWQSGPPQPPARYTIQGALGTDNMLYIAGGQTADATPIVYDQVSRYDYTANTWSNVAPLPVPTSQAATGAANGKIYVAGGFIGGTSVTNALRIYDIATNTWTSGANMPTSPGVEAAASAVVNGKFYVMGGDDFNNGLNTTFIYDIATNTWSTGATLPDSRTNTYGTASNGLIYVYGGVVLPAFTATDTLLRYDPVANSWTNLGSAGTGGHGNYGGVSPFGTGQLLITDGADASGSSTTSTHIFTISSGTFSAGPAMIGNRAGHAQGTLPDGRVLVADGFNTASTTVSTVELLTTPCPSPTPTATPTATASPSATPTAPATATPTAPATATPTATVTATPTGTPTATPSCSPNYTFTSGTGTLVPGVDDTGNHCDDCTTVISLPFSVTLYDQTFTSATVGSNGIFAFGTNNNAFAGSCLPVLDRYVSRRCPFYRDQRTDCTSCGIFTTTTGTAPNRVFRAEYRTIYFGETSGTPTLNYEVNVYENGSPAFDYTYGLVNSTTQTWPDHFNRRPARQQQCSPSSHATPPDRARRLLPARR